MWMSQPNFIRKLHFENQRVKCFSLYIFKVNLKKIYGEDILLQTEITVYPFIEV